jgi:DNA-directed RNA polymerase subunit RPC12/RpoP
MPITVTCSECEKKLKVKDELAGRKVRCPGCEGVILVPKAEEPELDELEEFDDFDDGEDIKLRKPAKKRRRSSEDEFDDELPVRKSSSKNAKKAKAKPNRTGSWDFFSDFYEGQLSQILAYIFWGVFALCWLGAMTGPYLAVLLLFVVGLMQAIRGLITIIWWARICAEDSPIAPVIYITFIFLPFVALIYGCLNNDRCEKPNRMFMFSIGISFMTFVALFVAMMIGTFVFKVDYTLDIKPTGAGAPAPQVSPMMTPNFGPRRGRR